MTAPFGAREPRRIARPPSDTSGFDTGRMTSSSKTSAPSRTWEMDNPETVGTSCRSRRAMRARRPPASKKSCMRYLPDGRMFARTGTVREKWSKSSRERSTPARPAMATRWMTALVEPPKARTTRTAFSKDSRESGGSGRSTIRRPAATAMRGWSESAAGIEAAPGMVRPRASTAEVIVEAVPIVMQWPGDDAMRSSTDSQSSSVIRPARSSSQYFQTSEPSQGSEPRQRARSIGPAGTKMNGRPAEMAPMTRAGVVLSQPPSSTAPSKGYDRSSSSVSIASRFR